MSESGLGELFTAAAGEFGVWEPLVWDPMGAALADRVAPPPGGHVLDACCGTGSSALPAAHLVGPQGTVTGVDLAEGLLRRAMARDPRPNVRFVHGDVTTWDGGPYDAVQCAYGVFMVPDMDAGAAHLAGLLRPGGRFGVAVWARGSLENFGRALYEAAGRHRPEPGAPPGAAPISRIDRPEPMRAWLTGLGLTGATVHEVPGSVPLDAERAWALVLGSGFRGALHGFAAETVSLVRKDFLALLTERGITAVSTTTLIGIATRPGG